MINLLLVSIASNPLNDKIKTVVLLELENRSFDHLLGWMNEIDPRINGLKSTDCNPLNISNPS